MNFLIKIALPVILGLALSAPASAALIFVNTTDSELSSDGDCSLLEAVRSANENTAFDDCAAGDNFGTDSIFLLVAGSILTLDILITQDVEILGPGMDTLTLDAGSATRHFDIAMVDETDDFKLTQANPGQWSNIE